MTISTDAAFDTAAAAAALMMTYLVELDFSTGTLRYTTWPHQQTWGGNTYEGLGYVGNVGQLRESMDGQTQTIDLTLSQVRVSSVSLALGSVTTYQGRAARIYQAVGTADGLITSAKLRFSGRMNKISIKPDGEGLRKIVLQCATGGFDIRKNPAALRMNDLQHQARKPGEMGFQYVGDLIARPQQWLSKRFQSV